MPLLRRAGIEPDKGILERVKRGEYKLRNGAPRRSVCWKFYRGEHYWYVNKDNYLQKQGTVIGEQAKPSHRIRRTRNLIFDFIEHDVSLAVQRVPAYEVSPSKMDPEDVWAATLSEKILHYGYERWDVKQAVESVVKHALVAKTGFAWPYYEEDKDEISIRTYGLNEVSWEPGLRFYESPWLMIQQARFIDDIQAESDFLGGKLEPDAKAGDAYTERSKGAEKLVLETNYLERPSKKNPEGKWVVIANRRQIKKEKPYPLMNGKGEVLNEPVLRHLSYASDPDNDEDLGLVEQLIDSMRNYNTAANKQIEWMILSMNPQVIIKNGIWRGPKLNDEPGMVYRILGSNAEAIWREVPGMPSGLSEVKEGSRQELAQIAAQNDVSAPSAESGKHAAILVERDQSRRANFTSRLAEFYARLGRDCLFLVQQFYTDERLLQIGGRYGPDLEEGFRGTDLRNQTDVTVRPGSIEARTRQGNEQKVMNWAQLGWISPEAAMAAVEGGTAEGLVKSYELDVERANLIIQKIRRGPDILFNTPPRPDGTPGWMPRKVDNLQIHKQIVGDYIKTTDFDRQPPEIQEACYLYYDGVEKLLVEEQMRKAMEQEAMAQGLGLQNAARPQTPSPLPSLPGLNGGQAQEAPRR